MIGAGLDTRPFRLDYPIDFKYLEIDLPSVIAFKQSLLLKVPKPSCNLILISSDVKHPKWKEDLLHNQFKPHLATLWILEGLTMYLDEQSVHSLLQDIASLSTANSHLLFHAVNTSELTKDNATDSNQEAEDDESQVLNRMHARMTYGVDNPKQLLEQTGNWKDIEVFDYHKIATMLKCEEYLENVSTNSTFTTATI